MSEALLVTPDPLLASIVGISWSLRPAVDGHRCFLTESTRWPGGSWPTVPNLPASSGAPPTMWIASLKGQQAGRSAGGTADQIRAGHQPENRPGARDHHTRRRSCSKQNEVIR